MWIGDFVRCHTVVKLLKARFPARPVDVLVDDVVRAAGRLHAGAAPGHRGRPAAQAAAPTASTRRWLSGCSRESYGTALIMPRTWKAALAPFLAGIPERIGWLGEWRFGLAQRSALGRAQAPAHGRPVRRLALPARRAAAGAMAAARAARAARRGHRLARAAWA